jgi:acyl dehydratase
MSDVLTPNVKQWIGREASYTAPEELGRAAIRCFAQALQDDSPLYRDEAFARQTRFGGIVAPPTLVCETNQYVSATPDSSGYGGHDWGLPLPHSRMVRVANEYDFMRPVRPSDVITATWRIVDINERLTRLGQMVFVESEVLYVNQFDQLLARNRETVAFQRLHSAADSAE